MLEKHDKAIEDADYVAKELDPKFSKAYYRKGVSYMKMGKPEKAVMELQQALKLEPDSELYKNELSAAKQAAKK